LNISVIAGIALSRPYNAVKNLKDYRFQESLLREQCYINEADPELVTLKDPRDIPAGPLQSPADPDATKPREARRISKGCSSVTLRYPPMAARSSLVSKLPSPRRMGDGLEAVLDTR
jgi:hypothetical protein